MKTKPTEYFTSKNFLIYGMHCRPQLSKRVTSSRCAGCCSILWRSTSWRTRAGSPMHRWGLCPWACCLIRKLFLVLLMVHVLCSSVRLWTSYLSTRWTWSKSFTRELGTTMFDAKRWVEGIPPHVCTHFNCNLSFVCVLHVHSPILINASKVQCPCDGYNEIHLRIRHRESISHPPKRSGPNWIIACGNYS